VKTVKKEPVKTARLGELPNEHGAYRCEPDETARWEHGREWAVAKLLQLSNGKYLCGLDYRFTDGGQEGPIFAHEFFSRDDAIAQLHKGVKNFMEMAQARGRKKAVLDSIVTWGESFLDADGWTPAPAIIDGEVLPVPADLDKLRGAIREADSAARQAAQAVGYLLPGDSTDPDLICRDIASNMRRSVEAVLEIGKGLIVLKAACDHGTFMERIEAMGIEPRLSQRFMQSALKFSNASTSTHLLPKIGNTSKLFELLVLDDEAIDELAETGKTGELKLDEVACMSVSELRKSLRELKAKAEAKDKVAADLSESNRQLREQLLHKQTAPEPDSDPASESVLTLLAAIDRQALEVNSKLVALNPLFLELAEADLEEVARREARRAALGRVMSFLRGFAERWDVPLSGPDAIDEQSEIEAIMRQAENEVFMRQGEDASFAAPRGGVPSLEAARREGRHEDGE
jgi:hypothetical protein